MATCITGMAIWLALGKQPINNEKFALSWMVRLQPMKISVYTLAQAINVPRSRVISSSGQAECRVRSDAAARAILARRRIFGSTCKPAPI